ncbi:MAG TPA: 3-hydroxyacyl-CoA dehydrogenase NAD-binding domain-containing protein, partial [Longimicrobiales bacterium]
LTLTVDGDGIAWLTFDRPDSKANILTGGVMARLDALLAEVEAGARSGRVRALVLTSGKPGMFIAGANIDEIADITDPAEAEAGARKGQGVFLRLDRLPLPTVAAIDGVCLGGGTEMILACDYRIAADAPQTRIGVPEIQLGIIPGFGGTTRLPRLVGLANALPLILTGKPVNASKAYRIGLVHERVHPAILLERTRALVQEVLAGKRPQARKPSLMQRAAGSALGRSLVLSQARKQVLKETKGHYPAPLAALETIKRIESMPLEAALAEEARTVGRLIVTPVSKNLIHVFRLMEAAKKPVTSAAPRSVAKVGVVGAGVMGGGIAQLLAYRGFEVRLKDIQAGALGHGLKTARALFDRIVKRGRLHRRDAERMMSAISPTLDYSGFGTTELVIEAVVERMDVKKAVLKEVEGQVEAGAVLTSNTSALSISEMQRALERPADFCGMHFFNPVNRMPLVEIVRGETTGDEAIATVWAITRKLEKTPVLVKDGPGFLVNRILAPYMNEAGWLLADGASIESIDKALVGFGMPMGPMRLLDEVGLDVAHHVSGILYQAFGERMKPAPALENLPATKRLGRKGGLGFYTYENGREKDVDQAIYAALGLALQRGDIPREVIQERCVLVMVNEAARVLEEEIVRGAGEVDLGLITGTGFPPFRGGLLRYADTLGMTVVLERLEKYSRELGARFEPAPLIRERAASGNGFYLAGERGERRPRATTTV